MKKFIKLFLRIALATGFLSAVADRWGLWSAKNSAWGSWDKFEEYTAVLNPWFNEGMVSMAAAAATGAEVVLGLFLLLGLKTERTAIVSGVLLLIFGLSMTYSLGIKAPLDYSVFTASASAFALSTMKEKYLELDIIINRKDLNKIDLR